MFQQHTLITVSDSDNLSVFFIIISELLLSEQLSEQLLSEQLSEQLLSEQLSELTLAIQMLASSGE